MSEAGPGWLSMEDATAQRQRSSTATTALLDDAQRRLVSIAPFCLDADTPRWFQRSSGEQPRMLAAPRATVHPQTSGDAVARP